MKVNFLKRAKKNVLKNEKGQGMVEYILLLVVIIGLVFAFKGKIKGFFDGAVDKAGADMNNVIQ
jgi:Flp pilus assembly pilin Flp